ncbi:MAG: hypothetical protein EBU04_07095 [Verrucomicrobia bacterium]|nr:hypothetical protein [Verrucomicrobiota bacterium]
MINPRLIVSLSLLLAASTVRGADALPVGSNHPAQVPAVRPQAPRHTPMPRVTFLKPEFGDPLPGLNSTLLGLFIDGKEDFTRFGRAIHGNFDPLDAQGGSLLQDNAISPDAQEVVPNDANIIIHRNSPPVFGLGLIDAIPAAEILRNVRRVPVEGVKGKASMVTDVVSGKVMLGRFGWKAQQTSVYAFAADAYANEMGVTNRFFPTENAPNGKADVLARTDLVADPEDAPAVGLADFEKVANFMTYLGAPPQLKLSPSAAAGRMVFEVAACSLCHVPAMYTGPNKVPALANKEVPLFSDLLLHDMGTLGDGIAQGAATGKEMRTPPLWGLRMSAPYLHDGRASTVDDAIRAHDGEAKASRDRYLRLNKTQQKQLADFLLSI